MKAPPNVVYAQLKFMWASGAREDSLSFLRQFSASLARDLQSESAEHSQRAAVSKHKLDELSRLLARCYFKQGEWQVELKDDWGSVSGITFLISSDTYATCRGMRKIYYILIYLPHIMIQLGTRHGIHGH